MEPGQRGRERAEIRLPGVDALRDQPERAHQPPQAGIGRELAEEGLRVDRRVQQLSERVLVEEQQAVADQIGRVVRPLDRLEMRLVGRERGGQRIRGLRPPPRASRR